MVVQGLEWLFNAENDRLLKTKNGYSKLGKVILRCSSRGGGGTPRCFLGEKEHGHVS